MGMSGSASTGKRVDINCWQTVIAINAIPVVVGVVAVPYIYYKIMTRGAPDPVFGY
jgi:hypothetical protein